MKTPSVPAPKISFVPFWTDIPADKAGRFLVEAEFVAEVRRALNALAYAEAA